MDGVVENYWESRSMASDWFGLEGGRVATHLLWRATAFQLIGQFTSGGGFGGAVEAVHEALGSTSSLSSGQIALLTAFWIGGTLPNLLEVFSDDGIEVDGEPLSLPLQVIASQVADSYSVISIIGRAVRSAWQGVTGSV
jgi:hypothetical protein